LFTLASDDLLATIDPDRGADVLDLVHRANGVDVLLHMPVRPLALGVANESGGSMSETQWLANYRGGWQTLVPVAGTGRQIYGTAVGFHGEASVSRWTVLDVAPAAAELCLDLNSVPVRIDRRVSIAVDRIEVADRLVSLSSHPLEIDYVAHPAFGGPLLDGNVRITSGAQVFTFDPETPSDLAEPGSEHVRLDPQDDPLRRVMNSIRGERRAALGWLSGLDRGEAAIENLDTGLKVSIDWDASHLPYAWVWQELGSSPGFPWLSEIRAIAIEPASCQSGGAGRRSTLVLGPGQSTDISVGITVKG